MSYKLNLSEFSEFIATRNFQNNFINKDEISKAFCLGYVHQEAITKDIILVKSDLFFNNDISIQSPAGLTDERILTLTIPLSKDFIYTYESAISNQQYSVKENVTDVIISKDFEGSGNVKKNTNLKMIQINIKKDFLLEHFCLKYRDKIIDFFNQDKEIFELTSHTTNIKSLICANELLNAQNDDFSFLYTQSKVFEILSYELPKIFNKQENKKSNVKFSDYDLEALDKARIILTKEYTNPPSISELSKIIKLNEFKLKLGYKARFNETPYKTILNCRMAKGKELLETSDLNVQEIANSLGYKQACNFTKSFIDTYNIRPRDLIKSRKYYY